MAAPLSAAPIGVASASAPNDATLPVPPPPAAAPSLLGTALVEPGEPAPDPMPLVSDSTRTVALPQAVPTAETDQTLVGSSDSSVRTFKVRVEVVPPAAPLDTDPIVRTVRDAKSPPVKIEALAEGRAAPAGSPTPIKLEPLSGTEMYVPPHLQTKSGMPITTEVQLVEGYEIIGMLGRGAMGVVYKARQLGLNRTVALKMILGGEHASDADLLRFKTEAEAVAKLQHPNIVQIYDVGHRDGRPFFSLEFVEGGTLDQRLKEKALPPREAAQIVETLARAVHFAHGQKIIHRDLKPANVLLTLNGTPKITDFGLAKHLENDSHQTGTGSILGTPSYMAPEQAKGKIKELSVAVDTYALGAILYDALTGRPPFTGETVLDTLMQVENDDPVPPRRLQPRVPADLETICLKCLQKEPRKRYDSALALADDLVRFQQGEPIHARPITFWERAIKWARRRPAVAALVGALAFVLAASFVALAILWQRAAGDRDYAEDRKFAAEAAQKIAEDRKKFAEDAKKFAEEQKIRAEEKEKIATAVSKKLADSLELQNRVLYATQLKLAQEALGEGKTRFFREILEKQDEKLAGYRGFEWDYLKRLLASPLADLRGHVQLVQHVAFQPPDFGKLVSGSADGSLVWWDPLAPKAALLLHNAHAGPVRQIAFSLDGKRMASAGADGLVCLWDAVEAKLLKSWRGHKHAVLCLAFHPDGKTVASGGEDGVILLWQDDADAPLARLEGHYYPVLGLAFSPKDGIRLASVGMDKKLRLWDVPGRTEAFKPREASHWLTSVAYSASGRYLVWAGWDRSLHVLDSKTDKTIRLGELDLPVRQLGFGSDPLLPLLAVELQDGSVEVWNLESTKRVNRFGEQPGVVRSVCFSADSQQIASVNFSRLLREYLEYSNPEAVLSAAPGNDAFAFLVAGAEGNVGLWDLKEGAAKMLPGHAGPVRAIANLPAKNKWATAGEDGRIRVWDGATLNSLEVGKHARWANAVAWHPSGTWLASAAADGEIVLWSIGADKEVPRRLMQHTDHVLALAFAADGKTLLSGGADGVLLVWDVAEGKVIQQEKLGSPVRCLALDPRGRWLAVGAEDRQLYIWRSEGEKAWTLERKVFAHAGAVTSLAISRDGARLVTGGADALVKIWDPVTVQEILTFRGHAASITGLAFSSDGRRLVSADQGGTLLRWEAVAE